jgi:hypothetical protein
MRHEHNPSDIITQSFLSDLIEAVTDNHGATQDRYTVFFRDGSYITLDEQPCHPQGISQWGEGTHFSTSLLKETEEQITLERLPLDVQLHILTRTREAYADFIKGDGSDLTPEELKAAILVSYSVTGTGG